MEISEAKFLIVEDEFLIAENTAEILERAGCKSIRMVATVEEAITAIEEEMPTMVLTDIALGQEKTGIDLGALLHEKYHIPFIYITSHASPEILGKAKHTRPNAYIIKPFKNEDLMVAIELALFNTNSKAGETNETEELVVKEGHAMVRLAYSMIMWMEADGNYTTIHTSNDKRRVVRTPITELQEQLSERSFMRIHKSFVVNYKMVNTVKSGSLFINDKELPIGRTYQQAVNSRFKI